MAQLLYARQFASKTFTSTSVKDAYMKAVKWYATNVVSDPELRETKVEVIKGDNSVTLKMFASLTEKVAMEEHCQCCKEMHSNFYINEDTACNRCSVSGLENRLKQKLDVKVSYCRQAISDTVRTSKL